MSGVAGRAEATRGGIGVLPDDHAPVRTHRASTCGIDPTPYREFGCMGGGGRGRPEGRGPEPGDFVHPTGWSYTTADYWSAPATDVRPRPDNLARALTSLRTPTSCPDSAAKQATDRVTARPPRTSPCVSPARTLRKAVVSDSTPGR